MRCSAYQRWLSPYLDDQLDAADRQELEAHLNGCRNCASSLESMKRLVSSLHSLGSVKTTVDLVEGVRQRLGRSPDPQPSLRRVPATAWARPAPKWYRALWPWHELALAATVFLIVVIVGLPRVWRHRLGGDREDRPARSITGSPFRTAQVADLERLSTDDADTNRFARDESRKAGKSELASTRQYAFEQKASEPSWRGRVGASQPFAREDVADKISELNSSEALELKKLAELADSKERAIEIALGAGAYRRHAAFREPSSWTQSGSESVEFPESDSPTFEMASDTTTLPADDFFGERPIAQEADQGEWDGWIEQPHLVEGRPTDRKRAKAVGFGGAYELALAPHREGVGVLESGVATSSAPQEAQFADQASLVAANRATMPLASSPAAEPLPSSMPETNAQPTFMKQASLKSELSQTAATQPSPPSSHPTLYAVWQAEDRASAVRQVTEWVSSRRGVVTERTDHIMEIRLAAAEVPRFFSVFPSASFSSQPPEPPTVESQITGYPASSSSKTSANQLGNSVFREAVSQTSVGGTLGMVSSESQNLPLAEPGRANESRAWVIILLDVVTSP